MHTLRLDVFFAVLGAAVHHMQPFFDAGGFLVFHAVHHIVFLQWEGRV